MDDIMVVSIETDFVSDGTCDGPDVCVSKDGSEDDDDIGVTGVVGAELSVVSGGGEASMGSLDGTPLSCLWSSWLKAVWVPLRSAVLTNTQYSLARLDSFPLPSYHLEA